MHSWSDQEIDCPAKRHQAHHVHHLNESHRRSKRDHPAVEREASLLGWQSEKRASTLSAFIKVNLSSIPSAQMCHAIYLPLR